MFFLLNRNSSFIQKSDDNEATKYSTIDKSIKETQESQSNLYQNRPKIETNVQDQSDFDGGTSGEDKEDSNNAKLIPVEVFLGGSCNPTTWRADVAIPTLQKLGISFYNPVIQ